MSEEAALVVNKPLACGPTRTLPTLLEIQRGTSITFEELITTLYVHRYTGIVTCDFRRGRPVFYSLGKPRRGNVVLPP